MCGERWQLGCAVAAVAACEVVIDETHRLHESIAGDGTDEGPAAFLEVFAKGGRFGGGGEFLGFGPAEGGGTWFGPETKEIGVEVGKLVQEFEGSPGVVEGGADFALVPDDASVLFESGDVFLGKAGHAVEIESRESSAEIFAFAENGEPGETSLKSLETDLFEKADIVGDFPPPFLVVIAPVNGIVAAPPAAPPAIGSGDQSIRRFFHGPTLIQVE